MFAGRKLFIFDLDGTLVDSSPLHARAFDAALAPVGLSVDYETVAGLTTERAIDRITAAAEVTLDPEHHARLCATKRAEAGRLLEAELEALPGAVEFVRAARARVACALATSASPGSVDIALSRTGMTGWFNPVITAADVVRGKPDPETFLLALKAHGYDPGDALVFEDSASGLAAAAAAGIAAVRIGPDTPDWFALAAMLDDAP